MSLFGINIVPNDLAREVRDEFHVERLPISKRRRGWMVVKHHIDRPRVFRVGNTIYAHPDIIEKLKRVSA